MDKSHNALFDRRVHVVSKGLARCTGRPPPADAKTVVVNERNSWGVYEGKSLKFIPAKDRKFCEACREASTRYWLKR